MPEAERLAAVGVPVEKVAYSFEADGVPDTWRVFELRIEETLSVPYAAELSLVSDENTADPSHLVGKSCLLTMKRGPLERRLSGVVLSIEHAGQTHDHVLARITVGPAMATLAHQAGCRMFQKMSVPEIVSQVLSERLAPYHRTVRKSLQRAYPTREYCLQYQESDLDFVTRLMADEGIFFWFDQAGEHEEVVLADGNGACHPFASDDATVVVQGPGAALADSEALREFYWTERLRPTAIVLRDFDWTRPAFDLAAGKKGDDVRPVEREVYAYAPPLTLSEYGDGERYVADDGRARALLRWEEEQARNQAGSGVGYVTRFAVGTTFELAGASADLDGKYVITGVTHDGEAPEELVSDRIPARGAPAIAPADGLGARERYRNRFTCIPADVPYRPPRAAARPRIPGLQSALVVGPAGEEIHTDPHGRIRVRFPWDRDAKGDETSSCWVRVAQVWSGPGWGFMFVPRIGMEVLVAFMDGDPNRPLVVGCAHNGSNPTPYGLPGDKTRSSIKTSSSPGGNGFNELRFEDSAGNEEVFVHAQKDMNRVVLHDRTGNIGHDETIAVGHDETTTVGNNRALTVGVDETITVGANRKESIGANESRQVAINFKESIGANASIDIGANKRESVKVACAESIGAAKALSIGAAYQVSVGGAMNETIGGLKAEEIGGAKFVAVGLASAETVGLVKSVHAGIDIKESAGKNIKLDAGDSFLVTAGKKGTIEITEELTLKCGDAVIKLKSNGDILIKGAKINIKGSGDVVVKGSNIGEN